MQAVIMAGGKGTRLASITKGVPKPMVTIAGKPLLQHQIENLRENNVKDIIIVISNYGGEIIQDFFQDGSRFDVNISYYIEETSLGTAGALSLLKDCLENIFILVFGDLLFDISLQPFLEFHQAMQSLITLFVHPNSHPYDSDIVIVNRENQVVGWSRKGEARSQDYANIVNSGIYLMKKSVADVIAEVQGRKVALKEKEPYKVDLEKEVIIPWISSSSIFAYYSTEYIKDVGTPDRLEKVAADFARGICRKRNLKYRQKCIFLDRDGTINKYVGFLRTANQMELEESAGAAIRLINESGYLAVIVTNQPVVARGECALSELEHIHNRLQTLLGQQGAYVDALFFCAHHPDRGYEGEVAALKIECDCRKPKTGMLEQAKEKFHIDMQNSWIIGDTMRDVYTGKNAGMHTALLQSGDPEKGNRDVLPDVEAANLLEAVEKILRENT